MSQKLTDVEKISKLPWFIGASMASSIFFVLTFASSFFILFLSELGFDKSQTGFLLSLAPFCQIIGIFVGPFIIRMGYKRGFMTFYFLRKVIMSFILIVPVIALKFGVTPAYYTFAIILILFSISRAIAETAFVSWAQEIIPNSIRGKFGAVNSIFATLAIMVTFIITGYILNQYESYGLTRFVVLIIFGLVMGYLSVFLFKFCPGGEVENQPEQNKTNFSGIIEGLKDKNYLVFLIAICLGSFGITCSLSFVPLFLKEQIGINAGKIIWIDLGGMLGSILICYVWGWACDRYGSKPVLITSVSLLCCLPLLWFFVMNLVSANAYFAFGISFISGVASIGWGVAVGQYLYNTAVPENKKGAYLPLYYSLTGIVAGLGPLFGGFMLDLLKNYNFSLGFITLNSYLIVFGIGIAAMLAAVQVITKLKSDSSISTTEFVGIFLQGNPISAFHNILRFHWAGDEKERVGTIERLSSSKTILNIDELIEALDDPSFNVRHEAINSISKMKPNARLVDALLGVIGTDQPDLALTAVWALGKLGDRNAIIPLREMLLGEYELLQARSARALGFLGDKESIDFMLGKLRNEESKGLRVAYASALGAMQAKEAVGDILALLEELEDEITRQETALAIARILGGENRHIRLHRRLKKNISTTAAQTVLALKKVIGFPSKTDYNGNRIANSCAEAMAEGRIADGINLFCELMLGFPYENQPETVQTVIKNCIVNLQKYGQQRPEYLLLVLHTILTSANSGRKQITK